MRKSICLFIRLSCIAVAICGLWICLQMYPAMAMVESGFNPNHIDRPKMQYIQFGTQILFLWVTSLPCFFVLIIGWILSSYIKKGEGFSDKTSHWLKVAAWVLLLDVIVFTTGNLILRLIGWNDFYYLYVLLSIAGFIISIAFFILAHFVTNATRLREENESYI